MLDCKALVCVCVSIFVVFMVSLISGKYSLTEEYAIDVAKFGRPL